MKYLVLIGDVVASRRLPARAQFQRKLRTTLQGVNGRRKTLASPYTLTLGDEFQAVYRDAGTAFADVFGVLAKIAPVQARFALAVGEIVTPINPAQSIGMDGPAFHEARALLEALKADGRLLGARGSDAAGWILPDATLAVFSGLVDGWWPKRLELFAGLLAGDEGPELARQTGITPRAVNKNIRAADLDEWKRILDEITRLLNEDMKSR
jgi:SatD family (SatD)